MCKAVCQQQALVPLLLTASHDSASTASLCREHSIVAVHWGSLLDAYALMMNLSLQHSCVLSTEAGQRNAWHCQICLPASADASAGQHTGSASVAVATVPVCNIPGGR